MLPVTKAGRYELSEELGRGAMGVVLKALDPVIGRTVAVKTLRLSEEGTGMTHEELIARFQTEARAAGLLSHPNIVVVYDAGEEEGLFYITMEYVEGRSLQALLDSRQAFPLPRVMRLMEQACSALEYAHQHHVVHRDIKPANLMLTPDDTLKITDFGTAKILQFGTAMTQQVIGTPSYMSPEQVKGRRVDGRSDIFSLGVILYELVTGEKPFPGRNITTVIYKIVNEDPIPPRELDSTIHPGLSSVITRALAKEPGARYQSCREMFEALRSYREAGAETEATVVLSKSARPERRHRASEPHGAKASAQAARELPFEAERDAGKRRGGFWLALFLLLVIGSASYYLWPYLQDIWSRGREAFKASALPGRSPVQSQARSASAVTAPPAASETRAVPDAPRAAAAEREKVATVEPTPRDAAGQTEPKTQETIRPVEENALAAALRREAQLEAVITRRLQEAGLGEKVKLQVSGSTVTLSGLLTPMEHRRLLAGMRMSPALHRGLVRVVDHIEYSPASDSPTGETPDTNAASSAADSPEVSQVVVQVTSQPAQATVFIDGRRLVEQTPTALLLLPGEHRIVLRKPGFQSYDGVMQIRNEETSVVNVQLTPLRSGVSKKRPD